MKHPSNLKEKALAINTIVNKYFQTHPSVTEAKPKDLMNILIKEEIFKSDHREGLPLRNVLRNLDKYKLLHLLPLLRVERKNTNCFWFFTTARHQFLDQFNEQILLMAPSKLFLDIISILP